MKKLIIFLCAVLLIFNKSHLFGARELNTDASSEDKKEAEFDANNQFSTDEIVIVPRGATKVLKYGIVLQNWKAMDLGGSSLDMFPIQALTFCPDDVEDEDLGKEVDPSLVEAASHISQRSSYPSGTLFFVKKKNKKIVYGKSTESIVIQVEEASLKAVMPKGIGKLSTQEIGKFTTQKDKNAAHYDEHNTFDSEEVVIIKECGKYQYAKIIKFAPSSSKYLVLIGYNSSGDAITQSYLPNKIGKLITTEPEVVTEQDIQLIKDYVYRTEGKEVDDEKQLKALKVKYQHDLKNIATTLPFQTLTNWTNACFKTYPEYSSKAGSKSDYPTTQLLSLNHVVKIVHDFMNSFKTNAFSLKKHWLNEEVPSADFFNPEKKYTEYGHAHVQKLGVPAQSLVYFIGDFHGSLHSLLRILWHFVSAGHLNDNFKIIDDRVYIIFNGDLIDRGRYSIEVLYTIFLLKINNWKNVFILRGNHEDFGQSSSDGFRAELDFKYKNPLLHQFIAKTFEFFPLALYLGSGTDNSFVQCCHGGIEVGFNPKNLLEAKGPDNMFQKIITTWKAPIQTDIKELLAKLKKSNAINFINDTATGKTILMIYDANTYSGFNWSDFEQDTTEGKIILNSRGAGYAADVIATKKYLAANTSIKAFFRGHQDMDCSFKMLFHEPYFSLFREEQTITDEAKSKGVNLGKTKLETIKPDTPSYPDGPYYWKHIVGEDKDINDHGFLIYKYVPVFTFTTATEPRGLPHYGYGALTTQETYNKWRLKPYEFEFDVSNYARNGKYVQLVYNKMGTDRHTHVSATFKDTPVAKPIPDALIALAQTSEEEKDPVKNLIGSLEELRTKLTQLSSKLTALTSGA